MKLEDSTAFTARCFRGEPASCMCACPFHLDIRGFLDKAGRKRWTPAYKMLRDATVFPGDRRRALRPTLPGAVPAHRRWETRPSPSATWKPRCCGIAKSRKPDTYVIPPKEQRVAVVGAGVSGLACALNLAQKRYRVTVFEREAGGAAVCGPHPRFAEFDADIALQFSAVEVEFRFGTRGGLARRTWASFDAIYVGHGSRAVTRSGFWKPGTPACSPPWSRASSWAAAHRGGHGGGHRPGSGGVQGHRGLPGDRQGRPRIRPTTTRRNCGRYLTTGRRVRAPLVQASEPEGYTAEEARAEAQRCLQCDCDDCMAAARCCKRFRKDPRKLAVEVYTDMGVNPPLSSRTRHPRGLLVQRLRPLLVGVPRGRGRGRRSCSSHERRAARRRRAGGPARLLAAGDGLRHLGRLLRLGPGAGPRDLRVRLLSGLPVGGGRPEHVLRVVRVPGRRATTWASFLGCCGAPAYWAGDEARLQANIDRDPADLGGAGPAHPGVRLRHLREALRLVSSRDPACVAVRAAGGLGGRRSADAVEPAAATAAPSPPFAEVAVFDPCAARGDDEMQESVRELARAAGIERHGARGAQPLLRPRRPHPHGQSEPL